ncbi:hypothetical protein [Ammoniphilus sp. CFH 90114]|uniref:hypothetical protein n=1 Tax=Ammoniphilus sp. CFH 90114 TaxID=2493665 RepID=UPI00100EFE6C|nr:hypothetical protein [Ammoniphilus sp. CFH 90114]RXT08125.1 hypothetical protein EIZ39_12025 [Ammoniphilus sp. CFH 90114]
MFENTFLDFATVSAVVAAFVSVVGNAFRIDVRYRALIAVVMGVILVSVPVWLMEKAVTALLIGLTASGVYTQVKKREYLPQDNGTPQNVIPPIEPPSNGVNSSVPRPPNANGPNDV